MRKVLQFLMILFFIPIFLVMGIKVADAEEFSELGGIIREDYPLSIENSPYKLTDTLQITGTKLSLTATDIAVNVSELTNVRVVHNSERNPITEVSGILKGINIWDEDKILTGDIIVTGELELRSIYITGNNYRIINQGKIRVNGNVKLEDASMNFNGGSMEIKSGSLTFVNSDRIAPFAPIVDEVTETSISVTGSAEAGSTVTVKVGTNVIGTVTTTIEGKFTVPIEKQKAGTKLTVIATDNAGNSSIPKEVTVKDVTAPNPPMVNEVTDISTKVIGIAEAGSTVTVKVGETELGSAVVKADGTFLVSITPQIAGTTLSVTATDKAGNVSEVTSVTVRKIMEWMEWQSKHNVPIDKVWTIQFNYELDPTSISRNIFISSNQGQLDINITINEDKKSVKLAPIGGNYKKGEKYTLYITQDVKAASGKMLNTPVKFEFTIE